MKLAFILALSGFVVACGSSAEPHDSNGGAGSANISAGGAGSAGASAVAGAGMAGGGSSALGGSSGAGGAATGGSSGAGGGGFAGALIGTCTPPDDVFDPIAKLSQTGCVDPQHPTQPHQRALSYEVNSPLWSDAADKTRAFVLPSGSKIHVRDCKANASDCPQGAADEGRWDFPTGSVMIKTFSFDGKVVETRLLMRVSQADWVGYSYQWDEAQSDATLVSTDGGDVLFDTGTRHVAWHYPSQKDCLNCHNAAAGSTLGPETAQLNRSVGGTNQLDHLATLGVFEKAPAVPYKAALVAPYSNSASDAVSTASTAQRARSYLHANCGFCHRPGGNYANFDFRNDTAFADMSICNAEAKKGAIANAPGKTKILVPGKELDSVLWLRMNEADPEKGRMPQVASYAVDHAATALVGDWIKTLNACP